MKASRIIFTFALLLLAFSCVKDKDGDSTPKSDTVPQTLKSDTIPAAEPVVIVGTVTDATKSYVAITDEQGQEHEYDFEMLPDDKHDRGIREGYKVSVTLDPADNNNVTEIRIVSRK